MKKVHIVPDKIGFVLTDKCTAKCDMCCFNCSPDNNSFQSLDRIKELISEAAERKSIGTVGFSGGEPFLAYNDLVEAVKFAHKFGMRVICTTNGFWGTDKKGALIKLTELKNAGLSKLSLSCDLFHQKYVDINALENILTLCNELDIFTEIGSVVTKSKSDLSPITSQLSSVLVNVPHYRTPCLPIGSAYEQIPSDDFIYDNKVLEKDNRCFECSYFAIYVNGDVFPCCSQIGEIEKFRLGNIHTDNLQTLYDAYNTNMYLRLIKKYGLSWFVDIARREGYSQILTKKYVNKCDLCHSIFTDMEFLSIAESDISKERDSIYKKYLSLQENDKR